MPVVVDVKLAADYGNGVQGQRAHMKKSVVADIPDKPWTMNDPKARSEKVEKQMVVIVFRNSSMLVSEAATIMRECRVGAMMVVDNGMLAGVFTERDALCRVVAEGRDARATTLSAVMTRNPRTVSPNEAFSSALEMMHEGRFRHVPVVEDGRPIGMVSVRDAMGPELESFVYEMLRQEQVSEVLA